MSIKELPSKAILNTNLEKVNQLLGIDKGDYELLSPEEVQQRITERIRRQDEIILPQRIGQGKLTSEWKKYMRKRK